MRVSIVAIVAAVLLAVGGASAATPRTGVWGLVTRGPITPVCVAGQPCTGPAKHVRLVFSQDGRVAGQVTTDDNGKYRLALEAGTYAVKTGVAGSPGRGLGPRSVRVVALRWRRVDFSLDTGIR